MNSLEMKTNTNKTLTIYKKPDEKFVTIGIEYDGITYKFNDVTVDKKNVKVIINHLQSLIGE